ncbi:UDP-N-acetylmuramate dehydrogenase [Selenomonas sp. WCT3]|uniref:UDP-N-acetylmuramate dehydrogenase n=1 Tax=unclassified Selenomonas TaxID=2637378 RepID=UPI00088CDBC4|nr:UDP-N-acetylmuramate dehydrogenase [Selenomonas sp.]MCR5438050.1 UDP-N-acetylmuramate dehydrogenase [Selenomonas sp.]SDG64754.1 UDP-N-acetylmuramate dehydrogenase [Selenomonas ruminantium]
MKINENFVKACQAFLKPEQLLLDEPMSKHTTFEIGGPADCLIFPASLEEVQKVLTLVKEYELPLTMLGNGSNMLVRDKGIRGVVIKFAEPMSSIRCEGTRIIAGAGALLKDVSECAAANGLTGLEYACGIPGSIGGAIFMNAGAYDGETKNVADVVRAVDQQGNLHTFSHEEMELGYRHSVFQSNGEAICEVELQLQPGDEKEIRAKIADYTDRRESKQPLEMPSAGSTFKRPEGYFAGTLIDQTGLKGFSVGGAQVSTKHAGFVVNTGGATAADVVNLIHEVQRRVKEKHGVELQPEVRMIGEE